MPEIRAATTIKVTEMIQAHADLLEQHGISAGLHAERPEPGTVGSYYLSTDEGIWARDNGTSWDEVFGFTEEYIQGAIDASITAHAGDPNAHHTKYTDAEAEAVASTLIATHTANPDAHHAAPTYDEGTKEIIFQIP
ncbi:hypothetical protein ES708_13706 [subsurface metagenome]